MSVSAEAASPGRDSAAGAGEHSRRTVWVVFAGLMLVLFLAALDQTIVATALPTIVGDLGGLNHLSWVVTAYLLAQTVVTPLYGKLGDLYGRKVVLQTAILIFLTGSALCGISGSIDQLIAFRALQGLGGGGLLVSTQAAIGDVVPPRERGRYMGLFGAVFGLASVAGPLLGGFLTTNLSWRWIFYVNLPLGAVALVVLQAALPKVKGEVSRRIDYLGTALLAAGLAAIVLGTSLGGTSHPWGSPLIVGLGAAGVLLLTGFAVAERFAPEPVLPLRLLTNRVFAVCGAVGLIVGFALFGAITYLPLFLQVVKDASPTGSGLQLLPLIGGLLVTSIGSGQLITRTGHYRPFPIMGTAVMVAGLYLLSLMGVGTRPETVALYMFVLGLGLGLVMQVLVLAVQNAVDYSDLGVATSGATLFRSMGGSIGTAVLGAIFANRLASLLKAGLPPAAAARAPTGEVDPARIHHLPPPLRNVYVHAFTSSLNTVFLVAAAVTFLAFVLTWFIPELPLRKTVAQGDMADTFAAPRDADSLVELVTKIGHLERREGAREIIRRIAARAGVDLSPAACWLLARAREHGVADLGPLANRSRIPCEVLERAREELVEKGLLSGGANSDGPYALTAAGEQSLRALTRTGEQRLHDLLEVWRPQENPELARLIGRLARDFWIDTSNRDLRKIAAAA